MDVITHDHTTGLPEDREPWTDDKVKCLGCGYRWIAVRMLASDVESLECPECGAFDSEFVGETPGEVAPPVLRRRVYH